MATLNALLIKSISKPGKYADGGGLYLTVNERRGKGWIFRYMIAGRRREMGIGSIALTTLAEARAIAFDCRKLVAAKVDPIEARKADRVEVERVALKTKAFGDCASEYIESQRPRWSCPRQVPNWTSSFTNHAAPILGTPVADVTRDDIVSVLKPIWDTKPVTASRLQNRLERVLGYAKAMGYRAGDNPAAWKENLVHILAQKSKATGAHHPAMPADDLPEFFPKLCAVQGASYRALEFLVLTVCRTKEVIGAEWREIDFEARCWTVPADRMKMRREHRVPLSDATMALLHRMRATAENQWLFPSRIYGRHLSNMACLSVMRRFGLPEVPHGFRSTFKDWACELSGISDADDISEKALAHEEKNKTKAAYKRADMFERRKPLMEAWGKFCTSPLRIETD